MRYRFLCILTALIWGAAFVAQVKGMDTVGPFTFNTIRFFMGSIVLWPIIYYSRSKNKQKLSSMSLFFAILCMGSSLFAGATLQQVGLQYTTASNAAFLTSTYILIVPFLAIFIGEKIQVNHIAGAVLTIIGVYAMSITDNFSINIGDIFMILSAFAFSFQILFTTHFTKTFSPLILSSGQFFVCGFISFCLTFLYESPSFQGIEKAFIPLLYTGLLSTGIAYTLQTIGQKHVPPTEASMLFSLEMVFGCLFGILFLNDTLTLRQYIGTVFMTIGIFLSQISLPIIKKRKNKRVSYT